MEPILLILTLGLLVIALILSYYYYFVFKVINKVNEFREAKIPLTLVIKVLWKDFWMSKEEREKKARDNMH